jgi:NADPH-dependent ferric siderophore reductase
MIESGLLVRHEAAVRNLVLARTSRLSPGFIRVTLGGEELSGFSSLGPTDHVKLVFGPDASGLQVARDYTPRAFRQAHGENPAELDIDFFVHDGDGPATAWARRAEPGDRVRVRGPRASRTPPTGVRRVILGADESALPAFARWIELLPGDVEILGFVELADESDAAYLDPDHVNRARVVWLHKRDGGLERAIRRLGAPGEECYLWVAGEATTLVPIRRYLRRELGLPAEQARVDGYWKRGEAGRNHHAPIDETDPED